MAALVDTNVLVYRFDHRFPSKQRIADELLRWGIENREVYLPHQAIVEFVAAVGRPRENGRPLLSPAEAVREAEEMLDQFEILWPSEEIVRIALRGPTPSFTACPSCYRRISKAAGSTGPCESSIRFRPRPRSTNRRLVITSKNGQRARNQSAVRANPCASEIGGGTPKSRRSRELSTDERSCSPALAAPCWAGRSTPTAVARCWYSSTTLVSTPVPTL